MNAIGDAGDANAIGVAGIASRIDGRSVAGVFAASAGAGAGFGGDTAAEADVDAVGGVGSAVARGRAVLPAVDLSGGGDGREEDASGEVAERGDRAGVGGVGRGVVRNCWVDCVWRRGGRGRGRGGREARWSVCGVVGGVGKGLRRPLPEGEDAADGGHDDEPEAEGWRW